MLVSRVKQFITALRETGERALMVSPFEEHYLNFPQALSVSKTTRVCQDQTTH